MPNRLLILLIGIAFVGCGPDEKTIENMNQETISKSVITEEKSIIKVIDDIPPMLYITENRYAYIKGILKYDNTYYLEADYVDYVTAQEAYEAEIRDKTYFIDGDDTISNITDGYYISNVNDLIRNFPLQPNMTVTHIIDDNGSQELEEPKIVNEELLNHYVKNNILVKLHIKDGEVIEIEEQFLP